jgi:hypothetical protein
MPISEDHVPRTAQMVKKTLEAVQEVGKKDPLVTVAIETAKLAMQGALVIEASLQNEVLQEIADHLKQLAKIIVTTTEGS